MNNSDEYFALVIGAGAGGLVVAKGLANAGKKVLLIEKGPYGGNCANFGCIPTKSLVVSANIAHELWRSALYGIDMHIENFSANRVMERIRDIISSLQEKNGPDALSLLGIDTISGSCSFVDSHTVQVTLSTEEKQLVRAKNIVIASGSHPVIPQIKGLTDGPYLTTQTIFSLNEIPTAIVILGGGQTGCELAQSFRRLGARVVLIEQREYLLGGEEPEASRLLQSILVKEGVEIYLGHQLIRVQHDSGKISLNLRKKSDEKEYHVYADQLMLACGRQPNVASLGLDLAGVVCSDTGITIDAYGRTNKTHIWAVGDVTGKSFYTHAVENQARCVLSNLLLPKVLEHKMDIAQPIPRVFFTDPEIASIGLTEEAAIEQYGPRKIATYYVPLSEADRAICQERSDGFVKFVTKRYSGKILGATIVAPGGQDMLLEISVAMKSKLPLRKLACLIHPYPTYIQIVHKAADKWFTEQVWPWIKRLFIGWK